jgi:hypothetical protein
MPEIDILAGDVGQTRTVAIQVKTKRSGTWLTTIREWRTRTPEVAELRFWVFVDLHRQPEKQPDYFVVPEAWMQADIMRARQRYLDKRGQEAETPGPKPQAIRPIRIEQWRDRWDLLGIL